MAAPNTSLDVHVETLPRVAGIERGRLHNEWLSCPFAITPAQKGFAWSALFATTDSNERASFEGVADTRPAAKRIVLDMLTKHISQVSDRRRGVLSPVYRTVVVSEPQSLLRRLLNTMHAWFRRRTA